MKVEVVQTGSPLVTGNYDVLGTSPNNDMVGAILWKGLGTIAGDGNNISSYHFMIGATDLTNNVCIAMTGQDAVANAAIASNLSSANCLSGPNAAGSTFLAPVANCTGQDPTGKGIRLNLTQAPGTARCHFTQLFSGTDHSMKVGAVQFASGDTSKVITHNLGGTPDVLIILTSMNQNGTDTYNGYGISIGFWDRITNLVSGGSSVSFMAVTGAATTNCAEIATNNSVGEIINSTASAVLAHLTVGSVGGTTFTLSLNTSAGIPNMVGWIALRGKQAQLASKNLLTAFPTSAGAQNFVNAMTGRPQVLFTVPTRLTNGNALATDDTSGGFGFGGMATNDYSATTLGAAAATFKDGVATSVARNMFDLKGIMSSLNTGANDISATMAGGTWDLGGVTPNYSAVDVSAFQVIGLAFGGQPALPSYPGSRTQFFVEDRVTFY